MILKDPVGWTGFKLSTYRLRINLHSIYIYIYMYIVKIYIYIYIPIKKSTLYIYIPIPVCFQKRLQVYPTVQAGKLECHRPLTPNERKKEKQQNTCYTNVPEVPEERCI